MLSRIARFAAFVGHARARHMLLACGLLIGLVLASGTVLLLLELRRDDIAVAERELKNLALVVGDDADRSLQAVEFVQFGLIAHLREMGIDSPEKLEAEGGSFAVHQDLQNRIAGMSHIAALALVDRYGQLRNISRSWPTPRVDDADRDFVQAQLAPGAPPLFISAPSQSRISGRWTIYFTRRFSASDGRLIGIVAATIETDYFEQFFSRISLTGEGSFALYRNDGMLLARYPHVDREIGKTFGDTATFTRVLGSVVGGAVMQASLLDGRSRLIAPYSMAHNLVLIVITNTMDAILADWYGEIRNIGGAAVLLELVVAGLILLGVRHLLGYETLETANAAQQSAEAAQAVVLSDLQLSQERERAGRELHSQSRRFDTALNNMLQGLLMFDHAGLLLVVNRRFCKLFDLPQGALTTGMPYRDVTERVVTAGCVTADEMREDRERRTTLIDRRGSSTAVWELVNGRAFTVTHQAMEEGWLTTFEEITERRQAEASAAHLARHDGLTNLPNRVLFREELEQAVVHARRGQGLALLCLDLDQFKGVNDTLGHPTGDALLQAVAERLSGQTRGSDTVARLGGDEFAFVQTPIGKPTDATAFAERLIALFDAPFVVAGQQIAIGTSIGIAFAPQDGLDPDQLLKNADLALCRAKVDGRGVYRLFHAEMDAQMAARRRLELDLRQALKIGQLEVFYQPVVDLRANAVSGFEALLRWRHPEKGLVPPDQFIPLAEEIGLIVPIGEWVLREACAAAASWPGEMRVAVNLSPAQFKSGNLVTAVALALRDADLPPDRLELEITETVILHDTDATLATLHRFRALGVGIALDDFGTGYSSLSYLRRIPFDRIKIDQSFVRDVCSKRDCRAIVRAVTGLANELGMATTAEGVETREQLDAVTQAGCTEVQGYLFSPAVSGRAVPDLLQTVAGMLLPRSAFWVPEPVL
jgi:diguanylate cyclase (GGDEF)-like protein